jgi:hypothetical protein
MTFTTVSDLLGGNKCRGGLFLTSKVVAGDDNSSTMKVDHPTTRQASRKGHRRRNASRMISLFFLAGEALLLGAVAAAAAPTTPSDHPSDPRNKGRAYDSTSTLMTKVDEKSFVDDVRAVSSNSPGRYWTTAKENKRKQGGRRIRWNTINGTGNNPARPSSLSAGSFHAINGHDVVASSLANEDKTPRRMTTTRRERFAQQIIDDLKWRHTEDYVIFGRQLSSMSFTPAPTPQRATEFPTPRPSGSPNARITVPPTSQPSSQPKTKQPTTPIPMASDRPATELPTPRPTVSTTPSGEDKVCGCAPSSVGWTLDLSLTCPPNLVSDDQNSGISAVRCIMSPIRGGRIDFDDEADASTVLDDILSNLGFPPMTANDLNDVYSSPGERRRRHLEGFSDRRDSEDDGGSNDVTLSLAESQLAKQDDEGSVNVITVSTISIFELDANLNLLQSNSTSGLELLSGDTFRYESVVSTYLLDGQNRRALAVPRRPAIPKALVMHLVGETANGKSTAIDWIVEYSNDCAAPYVFQVGESLGWAVFVSFFILNVMSSNAQVPTTQPIDWYSPLLSWRCSIFQNFSLINFEIALDFSQIVTAVHLGATPFVAMSQLCSPRQCAVADGFCGATQQHLCSIWSGIHCTCERDDWSSHDGCTKSRGTFSVATHLGRASYH